MMISNDLDDKDSLPSEGEKKIARILLVGQADLRHVLETLRANSTLLQNGQLFLHVITLAHQYFLKVPKSNYNILYFFLVLCGRGVFGSRGSRDSFIMSRSTTASYAWNP